MLKKIFFLTLFCLVLLLAWQLFWGGVPEMVSRAEKIEIIAHRGVHQNYHPENMDWLTTCTAARIYPPTHDFIENTLESIGAAFEMGATIVEIDVNRTADDHLVVFHDWMLECRTEGHGKVNEQSLAYLKTLDVGYGYTFDTGQTFPFRGKGVGKMPTLREVFENFPDKKFLIDHKDGSLKTAELLVELIQALPRTQQQNLTYWGPDKTFDYVRAAVPVVRRLLANRRQHKQWFTSIWLTLGLGALPAECRGQGLGFYPKYTQFLPGWPYRFLKKVHAAGARFYLYVETVAEAQKYAHLPVDGFITDYIERVGPFLQ
jgi:glycerophosphoryl diester phosphodiesterase